MARAWLNASTASGLRGLLPRLALALWLTVTAVTAQAQMGSPQMDSLPLMDFMPEPAFPSSKPNFFAPNLFAAERAGFNGDNVLALDSRAKQGNEPSGVIAAQYQMEMARLQPTPQSFQPEEAGIFQPGAAAPANLPCANADCPEWDWRLLPTSLVYSSYWAAPREPRFAGVHFFDQSNRLVEEGELGARFGLLRYGTPNDTVPQGFQWDVEGAAFPRLLPYEEFDMASCDYRVGTDCSYGVGDWRYRFGYYHLSSHVADEYMLVHPDFVRVRYKRETLIWGISNYPTEWARLFFECGCAFSLAGQGKPLEFIFGTDLGTTEPTGFHGAPFAALAVHLRQEVDFGGSFTTQAGWMWRDKPFGHVFRVGFQYLTGYDPQNEFLHDYQQQYGVGVWYDF